MLIPEFSSKKSPSESQEGSNQNFWILIQVLSIVPSVFSSVYKEKALGDVDIDVTYLNGWVAFYQLCFCIPLAVPSAWAERDYSELLELRGTRSKSITAKINQMFVEWIPKYSRLLQTFHMRYPCPHVHARHRALRNAAYPEFAEYYPGHSSAYEDSYGG